jgi:hypothetical protein
MDAPLDKTNVGEEGGDSAWFWALIFKSINTKFATVLQQNIAKLKVRFPDKFDAAQMDDANRDLSSEKAALGGKHPSQSEGNGF